MRSPPRLQDQAAGDVFLLNFFFASWSASMLVSCTPLLVVYWWAETTQDADQPAGVQCAVEDQVAGDVFLANFLPPNLLLAPPTTHSGDPLNIQHSNNWKNKMKQTSLMVRQTWKRSQQIVALQNVKSFNIQNINSFDILERPKNSFYIFGQTNCVQEHVNIEPKYLISERENKYGICAPYLHFRHFVWYLVWNSFTQFPPFRIIWIFKNKSICLNNFD